MGAMRDKVTKLQNVALSKKGRIYAGGVALFVAFFALHELSQRSGERGSIKAIPSRFLFSAGAHASPMQFLLECLLTCFT
jgi:hypothetical protein